MMNLSDLARGASGSQESGEASASSASAAAADRDGAADGRDVGGGEAAGAWTGGNKTKIQSAPASRDPGKVSRDEDPEQIEGLDWGEHKLREKINYYLERLNHGLPDNDDEEFWVYYDEQQRTELNRRLALYRIRAYEEEVRQLEDEELRMMYPPQTLEDEGYFEWYERSFEWYFDPEYCKYARLQDYQRLMLPDNGEYEHWEYYRETCSTLEGDQEYVQFWEKLSSETKWIGNFLKASLCEWQRIERVAFYHALKIAAEFPNIFGTLIRSGYSEYLSSVWFDNTWYKYFVGFYFEIWRLIAKQKMNFKDALKQMYEEGPCSWCRSQLKAEYESNELNPGPVEHSYQSYLAHIDGKVPECEARLLVMEAVRKIVPGRKVYYDYAKKKLDIAERIGLISSSPHKSIHKFVSNHA